MTFTHLYILIIVLALLLAWWVYHGVKLMDLDDTAAPSDCADTQPPLPVLHTCEALGVCQHPERECPGSCQQRPRVHAWKLAEPSAPVQVFEVEDLGRDNIVTALLVAAVCGITLGVIYGAGRWAWQVLA